MHYCVHKSSTPDCIHPKISWRMSLRPLQTIFQNRLMPPKWFFNLFTPALPFPFPLSYSICCTSLFLLHFRNQVPSFQQRNLWSTHYAVFSSLMSFLPPYLAIFPSKLHSQCSQSPSIYSCTVSWQNRLHQTNHKVTLPNVCAFR